MHPSHAPHRVDISGDVEYGRPGGGRPARPASLHFSAETALSTDEVNVALLPADTAHDRLELDGVGSLQADGLLWVTVTIRFLTDDGDWPEAPEAADAWTTVVSVDTSSSFVLRIEGEDREWAQARGTILHRASAASPPVPIRRSRT